mmetsp:Transcript_17266/g.17346  ORF Transcript_17266/g.17346 Transcript_17266/m.17346 type:complete len:112 (+) Transcript_17266:1-336(+)
MTILVIGITVISSLIGRLIGILLVPLLISFSFQSEVVLFTTFIGMSLGMIVSTALSHIIQSATYSVLLQLVQSPEALRINHITEYSNLLEIWSYLYPSTLTWMGNITWNRL